jgi:ribosomal-protein-serine acetyltransferase
MLRYPLDEDRYLRLTEEADAEEMYAVVDANREFLARWMPWAAAQTLETTREYIRISRRQFAENQGLQLVIVEHDQIVGGLGFHKIDWVNRWTSIGYWIAEASQGRGTVTRAVRALTNHALTVWRLNRVEIQAGVENERSRAIPERLGFRQEGVLRQAERVGDRYVDHAVYAMLAEDWPASTEPR